VVSIYVIRLKRTRGIDEPTRLAKCLSRIHGVYIVVVASIHTAVDAYKGFFLYKHWLHSLCLQREVTRQVFFDSPPNLA
jgi:hypothetical protein